MSDVVQRISRLILNESWENAHTGSRRIHLDNGDDLVFIDGDESDKYTFIPPARFKKDDLVHIADNRNEEPALLQSSKLKKIFCSRVTATTTESLSLSALRHSVLSRNPATASHQLVMDFSMDETLATPE